MNILFYQFLFLLNILVNTYFEIEVVFITNVLIFTLSFRTKIDNFISLLITLISLLFLIAFSRTLFFTYNFESIIKDVVYMSKPIFGMFNAYFLTSRINNKDNVLKLIIYIGVFFASIHLIRIINYCITIPSITSFNTFRKLGLGNLNEIICLILLLFYNNSLNKKIKNKKKLLLLLCISIIFYFSRTMLVYFFIIIFSIFGFFKFNQKRLSLILFFTILISLFIVYINNTNYNYNDKGFINGFIYKIKNSKEEVFNAKINPKDHKQLWQHWRAYEASQTYKQVKNDGVMSFLFGQGLGSTTNLEISPKQNKGIEMQFIPFLHNGFATIFLKTGLLGLFIYLIFLVLIIRLMYLKHKSELIYKFISGLGISLISTTLVVNGIYNSSDLTIFYIIVFYTAFNTKEYVYKSS